MGNVGVKVNAEIARLVEKVRRRTVGKEVAIGKVKLEFAGYIKALRDFGLIDEDKEIEYKFKFIDEV